MSEIDDLKRRAGITEDFGGGGTNPVQDIANAHVRGDIDGGTLMQSIVAASGGNPQKAIEMTLQIIDRLTNFPGATQKFIDKIKSGQKSGYKSSTGNLGL